MHLCALRDAAIVVISMYPRAVDAEVVANSTDYAVALLANSLHKTAHSLWNPWSLGRITILQQHSLTSNPLMMINPGHSADCCSENQQREFNRDYGIALRCTAKPETFSFTSPETRHHCPKLHPQAHPQEALSQSWSTSLGCLQTAQRWRQRAPEASPPDSLAHMESA